MRNMKDSGIEWIGATPVNWEVKPLKQVLKERKENNNPIKTDFILSLTNDRGVIPYSSKGDIGNKSKDDITRYKLAYPNDIVLNSMNVIIGSVGLSSYFGAVSPVYYMLYTRNKDDNIKYFNYIFQTKVFQQSLKGYGNGILEIRMRIPMSKLNTVSIPYPSLEEQELIADYLDNKVKEIDNIISKTKETIEEYKKYKQSVITEVVTKGLNPDVEMKDSGIEWIGEIPKEWKVRKVKNYYKLKVGFTPDTKNQLYYDDENGYDWVTINDLSNEKFIFNSKNKISQIYIDEKNPQIIPKGSLLYSFKLSVGQVAFAGKDIYSNEAIASFLDSDDCNLNFLYYSSFMIIENSNENIYGAKLLNQNLINNAYIVFPPLQEQELIADYLDNKVRKIDNLISKKQELITQLEQYKKSLIYEYVTGKKEINKDTIKEQYK